MAPYFEQYKNALQAILKTQLRDHEAIIKKTKAQLRTVKSLPTIDIFVETTGAVALSDFANAALQNRLEAKNPEEEATTEKKLKLIFDVNKVLKKKGIKRDQEIFVEDNPKSDSSVPITPAHPAAKSERFRDLSALRALLGESESSSDTGPRTEKSLG